MIVAIPDYQISMELKEDRLNSIIVENEMAMTDIVMNLQRGIHGESGSIGLYEDNKELSLSKVARLIIDPFSVDLNERQAQKALYKELITAANEDPTSKGALNQAEVEYLDSLLVHISDSNVVFSLEPDMEGFFKYYNVSFSDDYEDLSKRLIEYVRIMSVYCRIELFIFVNLKAFLSPDEMEDFRQMVSYYKVICLFVESRERVEKTTENTIIIDNDLCLIRH